jgi:hypothetical protein
MTTARTFTACLVELFSSVGTNQPVAVFNAGLSGVAPSSAARAACTEALSSPDCRPPPSEFSNVTRSYAGKGIVRYAW